MRILMINPGAPAERLGPMARFSPAIPPLGIVWPATVLAGEGHKVRVIDQHGLALAPDRLIDEVRGFAPQLVGFSCLTFAMDGVAEAVKKIRSECPGARVVLGNLHATLFHERVVESGLADFVVRREGEITLARLAAALDGGRSPEGIAGLTWKARSGRVVVEEEAGEVPLDELPAPDWNLVSRVRYEAFRLRQFDAGPLPAAVQASRGCQFNCSFCSQNLMVPRLRIRSVERVVDEIEQLHSRLGIAVVGFVDANFPPNIAYGLEFARRFIARGLHKKVRWFTEVRPDLVSEELIAQCVSAGLGLVQFGVESADEDVLRTMDKSRGRQDVAAPFEWCRKHGVLTVGLFVIGMPGETERQIESTVRLALRIDPDLAKFSVATPYPGSALWHRYRAELEDVPAYKFSGWLDPARGGEHLLGRHTLPGPSLARLQRSAMRRFYARPGKLARLFGLGLLRPETLLDGTLAQLGALVDRFRTRH
jgi:radical SAM superfamily enzyme YgiQ (UPF0313 family)